jgi:hypothetical protein
MRKGALKTFYEWLMENTNYIEDIHNLKRIRRLFDLNVYLETYRDEFKNVIDYMPFQLRDVNIKMLKEVLNDDGFIFA